MDAAILRYLGLAGTLIVLGSSGAAAVVYRGSQGEQFSILNHFVSELGEIGVSRWARLFNMGLLLGGLLVVPFLFNLGLRIGSWLGWLSSLGGAATGLALAAVGIFPMNDQEKHAWVAMTYFRAGLAMVCLFGLAFLFQPAGQEVVPAYTSGLSFLAAACYASFLFLSKPKPEENPVDVLDSENEPKRPRIWMLPIVEWLVFFSTVGWILGIALSL